MTRADWIAGVSTVLVLALIWTLTLNPDHSFGWDESMHAALPATRMLTEFRADGFAAAMRVAVEDCQLYPPGAPFVLAIAEAIGGVSELTLRCAARLLYALGLLGLFGLAGEVAKRLRDSKIAPFAETPPRVFAFSALALGALCPLAWGFSATLFLEGPFVVCEVFALRAWLRRGRCDCGWGALFATDLIAGSWLVACFFTKFNYAGLLFVGLAVDSLMLGWSAWREHWFGLWCVRIALVALPLVLALVWWFVLPWPGDADLAVQHRENFVSFLEGNRSGAATPWSRRILDWTIAFVPTFQFGIVLLAGVLVTLRFVLNEAVRPLWLVLLALVVPISLHPFHLERFLIPIGPALWCLGALGLGALVIALFSRTKRPIDRVAFSILLVAFCFALPGRDARFMAKRVGLWNEERADYLTWLFESWGDLSLDRTLPTSGLRTETAERLVEMIVRATSSEERIGWLGISSEFSPAALHLGLLEARGSAEFGETFRRDAGRQCWFDFQGVDPGKSAEFFAKWAASFDVILVTDPPDLKARRSREWIRGYGDRLVAELGWSREELGPLTVDRPFADPIAVTLYACRPPR